MRHILTLSCIDRPDIVGAVGTFLADQGRNILECHQFGDVDTGRFFMHVVFETVDPSVSAEALRASVEALFKQMRPGSACAGHCTTPPPGRVCSFW